MTTTVNLRKILHRKSMEMCTPAPLATNAGAFFTGDKGGLMPQGDCHYYVAGISNIYNYNADQDAWQQLPNSGIAGTYAAGACGSFRHIGAMGGVIDQITTSGTTTTLITPKNILRSLAGCKIRVVSGTGAGYEGTIVSNTCGPNAVLTVSPANGVAFDATTVFRCWSGSLWFFNAGTAAVGFSVYDRATNAWTARSVTGIPTAWGTGGQLVTTGSIEGVFETGTSTGGNTTTTLANTGKTWPVNAYANNQLRITAGTGIGQVRIIASNTATTLTVSAAWAVTPDATSVYAVEGCDDYMYLLGNNAVTMYRFQISTNTWTTLAPTAARAAALATGGTADWVSHVAEPGWAGAQDNALYSTTVKKQNGRYIYSLRGGASNALDIYDIAANTWISWVAYGNQAETFTTGSASVGAGGYIYVVKEATGRVFRFDVAKHVLEPLTTNLHPQGAAVAADVLGYVIYVDGATKIPFLYIQTHSRVELLRQLLIV